MRAPTLKDVAQRAGVGVVTVSSVINGASTPTRVSPSTRQRIIQAAAELRYHPNAMARGLRNRRVHTIGVLFDTFSPFAITHNPHAGGILEGILTTGRETGYNCLVFTAEWQNAEVSAATFRDKLTDGILIVAPRVGSDTVEGLNALGIPTVVISTESRVAGVPWVDVDNAQGARLAAEHLAKLGHTRIAHLRGDERQWSVRERSEAFWARLAEFGIAERPEYVLPGTFSVGISYKSARHLLESPEPPTAIFATNDLLAMAALDAARDTGVGVPDELSIVGFDDVPTAVYVRPQLTTVRHPFGEVGSAAVHLLISRLNGEACPEEGIRLPLELIVRGSTGTAKPAVAIGRRR
jgi:LacI family transcriptional regulator